MSPDETMLRPGRAIVRFMESGDRTVLDGVFTADAELVDSFAPYVFRGTEGVAAWATRFGQHVGDHVGLRATLGAPQEFSQDGASAFLAQPVTWYFAVSGRAVHETGSMALVLRADGPGWRVHRYAWAVVGVDQDLATGA